MVSTTRTDIVGNEGRKRVNRRTGLWLVALALLFFVLGVIKYRMYGQ